MNDSDLPKRKRRWYQFEYLEGLVKLKRLYLGNTRVTDGGLEHAKGLHSLAWLDLQRTQVTAEGVHQFKRALPNCYIDSRFSRD